MSVKPIPDGYASVTPYLRVQGAAPAIEFYGQVFGAVERLRLPGPGGKIAHAEIQIGNSMVMLADFGPERSAASLLDSTGNPVCIHVYLANVDDVYAKAIAGGAKAVRPVADQLYGDRSGMFSDPFGQLWNVSTHVEDVSPEEMKKRMAALIPR